MPTWRATLPCSPQTGLYRAAISAAVLLALTTTAFPQPIAANAVALNGLQPYRAPAPVLTRRAEADRLQRDPDAAIADYDRAIKVSPKKIENLVGRGLAYLEKRDTDSAIRDFTQAIDRNPRHAGAIASRAQAYLAAGDLKHAISD